MAPKGMKRPAAAAAGAPAKVQKTIAGFQKKIDALTEMLECAEDVSESTIKMLIAALPQSIADPKDKRHPIQVKMIGWVQEVLASVEAACQKSIKDAEEEVASKTSKKDECQKAQDAAKETFTAKEEAVAGKKTAVADAEAKLKEAKSELKESEKAQADGDKELEETIASKAKLEEAAAKFTKLKTGGNAPEEEKELLASASQMGVEMELDQSMLTSLPSVFSKALDARGQFDNMVIDHFEGELKKRIDKFTETLAEGEPAKQERAAKVEAANAKVATCTSALETCREELSAATTEKDEALAATKTTASATKEAVLELKVVTSNLNEAKKELAQLEKGAMLDFKELEEWDGKPKQSQYKTIGGVRYERDLLEMAGDEEITMEKAEALFTQAMDGNRVTPTEKRTLRYIIKTKAFAEEAKNFLETKIGSSWYQTIEGVQYERSLLLMAADEVKPYSKEAAEKLLDAAKDGPGITACEKRTIEYILKQNEFTEDAKAWLEEQIAGLEEEAE